MCLARMWQALPTSGTTGFACFFKRASLLIDCCDAESRFQMECAGDVSAITPIAAASRLPNGSGCSRAYINALTLSVRLRNVNTEDWSGAASKPVEISKTTQAIETGYGLIRLIPELDEAKYNAE